jgi:hypothetical protein
MNKKRTVLLRTTSFSVEAGEAAMGARPALSHRTIRSSAARGLEWRNRAIAMRQIRQPAQYRAG